MSNAPMRKTLAALALIPLLAACASTVYRVNAALEDAFVPVEDVARFDSWRQKVSPRELLQDAHAQSYVELGRRFESGSGGLAVDRACAAYWYDLAFRTPYRDYTCPPEGRAHMLCEMNPTSMGYPKARVAMRRLQKAGAVAPAVSPEAQTRCAAFAP